MILDIMLIKEIMNKKIRALLFLLGLQLASQLYLIKKYSDGQKKYMHATFMLEVLWNQCFKDKK